MIKKQSVLIGGLVISTYLLGAITVQYKLFPFKEIVEYRDNQRNNILTMPIYEKNFRYRWFNDIHTNAYDTKSADIVMLGDSITYNVNWGELLNNTKVVNRGIASDIIEGFLHRLDNIIKLQPKQVFLMGGINDIIMGLSVDDIYSNYIKIIEKLERNNIRSIIQSTLFTTKLQYADKVELLNKKLEKYALEQNIDFIDLNKVLSKDKFLLEKYSIDGIHLNAQGYNVWKKAMLPYIEIS